MIQAGLLISVYELGHAIMPAAYISIGSCAREGIALGIHERNAPQMLRQPVNWPAWEERQRVWWLIIILDRSGVALSAYFLYGRDAYDLLDTSLLGATKDHYALMILVKT
jgi:hypothetical protein